MLVFVCALISGAPSPSGDSSYSKSISFSHGAEEDETQDDNGGWWWKILGIKLLGGKILLGKIGIGALLLHA